MKTLVSESLISEMKVVDKDSNSPALCIMEGPCMEFDKVNRNNRIYSRKLVEDRILNNPTVQEALKNKCMLGEGGHPESRVEISYPDVALCVEKLWIPDNSSNLLWGRFAILDTPVGHILETLVKYGSKIGISARAMTDAVQKNGHEVISETTYDLITFDAVPDPGFKSARLSRVESAMKPIDSMSISQLENASNTLKSAKVPAFESRIRMIDQEIEKRRSINIAEEVKQLRENLDLIKKAVSISKVKDIEDTISISKELVEEARHSMCAFKKVEESYMQDTKLLQEENKALRAEVSRLEGMIYNRSLSPDYILQMNELNGLVKRLESLDLSKPIKESKSKDFSQRYCVKENKVRNLLSNSKCESSSRDYHKIAQFEREPYDFLDTTNTFEQEEDSLTRSINAQIRR